MFNFTITVALVPEDSPVVEGGLAEFACNGPAGSTNRQYMINGTQFESLNLTDVTWDGNRILLFTNTPLKYDGTTVQCTLTSLTGVPQSSTVGTLLVQGNDIQLPSVPHITGLLDAVSDVIVEYNSPSFIISWTAPFTYQVPDISLTGPLISYCVSINNTSSGSIILNTNYSVELEYDPCVEYSATIIAVNPVGDGQPKVIPFPGMLLYGFAHLSDSPLHRSEINFYPIMHVAPGTILSKNFTPRAEAGDVIFEGSLVSV